MARTSSISCFARFARGALVATIAAFACVALRGEQADACGGGDWFGITELTTFDPKVLGESSFDGLEYDPFVSGYGGPCTDCSTKAMLADWQGYLTSVTPADWEKVLVHSTEPELAGIQQRLAGKTRTGPKGYEQSSLWKAPAAKDKLIGALGFVQLVRRVEPFASFEAYDPDGNQRKTTAPPAELMATARNGLKIAASDPFLAQRYAFQALRIVFYQRDWSGVVAFFDKNTTVLAGPSADLAWRARHYLAGALARKGLKGRANLELARIHAGYPPLSGIAAQEFQPMEEVDWRESLKLARTTREKTELWRLVGIKKDGVVAMQEILKLDPKSNLIGLLIVRELNHAESRVTDAYGNKPDPKDLAAQKKAFATIEQIAVTQVTRGGDRPWLMDLVAGHIAAKRGDLVAARTRLQRAIAGRPGDVRVASQAKASLAVALVVNWKIDPQHESELAVAMNGLDPAYGRLSSVRTEVRGKLAKSYAKAGQLVDAEFLKPGSVDPVDPRTGKVVGKPRWSEVTFIKEMIARTGRTATDFDRFVLKDSLTRPDLEQELALRYVVDGDFAAAAKTFQTTKATSEVLKTDPFAIRIVDCHDCDHARFEHAKWTHASFATRLAELELKARGGGETGAEAALVLGNALYNITWHGNARVVLEGSHHATRDASAALRWYKRAYELTKNRELKAKAAFLAAKSELGNLISKQDDTSDPGGLPIPATWFPIVKSFANTKYYKEVLKECGHFRDWARARP